MVDPGGTCIAGYVSLATGQIEREFLARNRQRNKPDPVPVLLLGQLAVDLGHQGRGCGADLLRHALTVALEAAASVGFVGVLTHPVNAAARGFYERWGFENLTGDPERSMIIFIRDLQKSRAGSSPGAGLASK
jgi:GNAT superfamily N-acetyltransferase